MRDKALDIIKKLNKNDYQAYLVGGCVRDMLLNQDVKDFDITTNATPDEIKKIFGETVTCGNTFLVSMVHGIEVATYRTDLENQAVKTETLKEDVLRRDFTINGLAMDLNDNILDFVGGVNDIKNRILRFIGNPDKRIEEDPVRILRGLRFMARYSLEPDYNTHFAIYKNREMLQTLPKERIQKEVIKAFSAKGAYNFVKLLNEYELLELVFPSVYELQGLKGGKYHNETVYTHCLNALKAVDFDNVPYQLKLACLYHDTGKKQAMTIENDNVRFLNHDIPSYKNAIKDFTELKFSNSDVEKISNLCKIHMFHILDDETNEIIPKRARKLFAELTALRLTIKEFIVVRYADNHSNMRTVKPFIDLKHQYKNLIKILNEKPPFSVKNLDINGNDIIKMGVPQSKKVGEILNILFELVINQEIENKKDVLIEKAKCLI